MKPWVKILIGLAAVLLAGWVWHGPLGHGAAYVNAVEQRAQATVAATNVPGVSVRLGRDPLSRHATLSGAADAFQREGQGELKGLNDIVAEVEGVSGYGWTDEGNGGFVLPLLAELLLWMTLAYLAGLALGWLLFGREKREGFY
jgi:hypothetical protein